MLGSVTGIRSALHWAAGATALSLAACDGAYSVTGERAGTGGGVTIDDAEAGFVSAASAGPDALEIRGPDCEERRAADCTGIEGSLYSSSSTFDGIPELSECTSYVSFDGCGKLIYAFDAQGCVTSVEPGRGGWDESGHLSLLRECLNAAFSNARYACLATRRFEFDESCFIH